MQENMATDMQISQDDLFGKYLTFFIGEKIYGVELLHVLEIISIISITTVPRTPNYVKGIINLRGRIVPVIDVRLKFGLEEKPYDERTCIIVLNVDEMFVGLIVDEVSEVLALGDEELSKLPEVNVTNENQYIRTIAKVNDNLIMNLDCDKFLQSDNTVGVHF